MKLIEDEVEDEVDGVVSLALVANLYALEPNRAQGAFLL